MSNFNNNNASHDTFREFFSKVEGSGIKIVRGVENASEGGYTWNCILMRDIKLSNKRALNACIELKVECTHEGATRVVVKGARGGNFRTAAPAAAYAVSLIDAKVMNLFSA